jgi:hypothetical protein
MGCLLQKISRRGAEKKYYTDKIIKEYFRDKLALVLHEITGRANKLKVLLMQKQRARF